jgi:hypothetical protein
MAFNRGKPNRWKADIARSVDMYNDWFMKFAPQAFRDTRIQTTKDVEAALHATDNITNIRPVVIRMHPEILPTLRMSTCPPLAVDRLIGLAGVPINLVKCIELEKKLPLRMAAADIDRELGKIATIIEKMADPDISYGSVEKNAQPRSRYTEPQPSSPIVSAVLSPILSSGTRRKSGSSPPSKHGSNRAATSSFPEARARVSTLCHPERLAFA